MATRHQFRTQPRNKYGVSIKGRRTRNGPYGEVLFASLKEARYYDDLILRQTAGEGEVVRLGLAKSDARIDQDAFTSDAGANR